MAYIDYSYYSTAYLGAEIPADEFMALAERASDFVDLKTFYRIKNIDELDADTKGKIKKATAIYTEQFYMQGGVNAYTGSSASLVGNTLTIGSTHISGGGGLGSAHGLTSTAGIINNPIADSLLASTGLCYRGIDL